MFEPIFGHKEGHLQQREVPIGQLISVLDVRFVVIPRIIPHSTAGVMSSQLTTIKAAATTASTVCLLCALNAVTCECRVNLNAVRANRSAFRRRLHLRRNWRPHYRRHWLRVSAWAATVPGRAGWLITACASC
uniref:Uncharacterized protein n=1 Tax=Cacopsylla melanoneura TaxID=428564 RepID=A0A8D8T5H7_9HEMI